MCYNIIRHSYEIVFRQTTQNTTIQLRFFENLLVKIPEIYSVADSEQNTVKVWVYSVTYYNYNGRYIMKNNVLVSVQAAFLQL